MGGSVVFTGIIETVGNLREVRTVREGRALLVATEFASALHVGDSVAVDGVCLTVERADADTFQATAVAETLARTTLSGAKAGDAVNLERAATADRLLGGHIVHGHVDGVGRVVSFEPDAKDADSRWLEVELPPSVHELCVEKGSIAVDGISLTVARVLENSAVAIAIVPHTLHATTASRYAPGTGVNVEADMVARYVREYVRRFYPASSR
jgi:riboflavin synthase